MASTNCARVWMTGYSHGSGLRFMECPPPVDDVDIGYVGIVVRDGKGAKDCVTVLPVTWPGVGAVTWQR